MQDTGRLLQTWVSAVVSGSACSFNVPAPAAGCRVSNCPPPCWPQRRGGSGARSALGQLRLQQGSLEGLPLPDRSLDGAITLNTIYFLAELTAAFAEFSRVLKPTGQIVVGLGDPVAMAKLPFTAHGFRLRPVDDVRAELSLAGLQLIDHRRVGEGPNAYHLLVATPTPAAPTS
jgi:SAM-dependent methyltransferase